MTRIGIVTAMPTEVRPLIRNWRRTLREHNGRSFRFYESDDAVVLPGGIGHAAGTRAAEAVIALYQPQILIATGLCGGLKTRWQLGSTLVANEVIDSGSGRRFGTATTGEGARRYTDEGVVVSSREIAGADEKRRLAAAYPEADVVDMEGAAVAEVAAARGLPFLAVKAVSDNLEFDLPPLNQFVSPEGQFQMGRFVAWAAVRPQWWPKIAGLKRISNEGAKALGALLNSIIESRVDAKRDMISGSALK